MKEIKLTQGKVALVDDEDFVILSEYKWYAIKNKNTFYAVRHKENNPALNLIRMHREITGAKHGDIVDHKNRDGLDNRRQNIRICTSSQNSRNRQSGKNSSSKYLGVTIDKEGIGKKRGALWRADIRHNGKRHYIGKYKDEEMAAIAYNEKAKKLHGEFANLNIIS